MDNRGFPHMTWQCYHLTMPQTVVTTEQFALHIWRTGTSNFWTLNKQNSVNISPGNIGVRLMPDTDRHLILIQQYLEVWKHNTVFHLIETAYVTFITAPYVLLLSSNQLLKLQHNTQTLFYLTTNTTTSLRLFCVMVCTQRLLTVQFPVNSGPYISVHCIRYYIHIVINSICPKLGQSNKKMWNKSRKIQQTSWVLFYTLVMFLRKWV
jgi:hypothetical protein